MNPRAPVLKPREVVQRLERLGFVEVGNADLTNSSGTPMVEQRQFRFTLATYRRSSCGRFARTSKSRWTSSLLRNSDARCSRRDPARITDSCRCVAVGGLPFAICLRSGAETLRSPASSLRHDGNRITLSEKSPTTNSVSEHRAW